MATFSVSSSCSPLMISRNSFLKLGSILNFAFAKMKLDMATHGEKVPNDASMELFSRDFDALACFCESQAFVTLKKFRALRNSFAQQRRCSLYVTLSTRLFFVVYSVVHLSIVTGREHSHRSQ